MSPIWKVHGGLQDLSLFAKVSMILTHASLLRVAQRQSLQTLDGGIDESWNSLCSHDDIGPVC